MLDSGLKSVRNGRSSNTGSSGLWLGISPYKKLAATCETDYQVLQRIVEGLEKSNIVKLQNREKVVDEIVILSQEAVAAGQRALAVRSSGHY